MKKKILHILNSSNYSGAENVVIQIIKKISNEYECAYVSKDGSIRKVVENNMIKFLPTKSTTIFEVLRVVKKFKPDIIHAHDYTTSIVCALSGIKTPIISHLHNNSPWIKKHGIYSFKYLISTLRYRRILFVSSSIIDEYVFGKYIINKSIVISNPINVKDIIFRSKQAKDESNNVDIIFLGRLTIQKNPLKFIELIKIVVIDYPNIQVFMIGDGELKDKCLEKIAVLGLSNNIQMLGFMENPYGILSKAKILCMTSDWEGYGLVAVEALSLGIPVVATPVGGIPNIIDDSCGFLTDSDGEYISEINKLLSNNNYREEKSKQAIEKSKKLDNIEEYINRIKNLYREILN